MNQSCFKAQSRASAFTLIELLVVIAIIAILAAILFPVFAQAREKARQTQCLNNTKQLALGMMQYVQDFDETFPSRYFPNNESSGCAGEVWWIDKAGTNSLINPYLKNTAVAQCPSNRADSSISAYGNAYNFAYGYNGELIAVTTGDCTGTLPAPTVVTQAKIQTPSSMIMFGDDTFGNRTLYTPAQGRGTWGQNFTNPPALSTTASGNYQGVAMSDTATNSNGNFPLGRHLGGVEMAFCDGHSKWVTPDALYNAAPTATTGNNCAYYNGIDSSPTCATR